jgi:hypothetical protein
MMKKKIFVTLFIGITLLIGLGHPSRAMAGVNINVGITVPPPPPLVIPTPPPLFVIPGTYAYIAPEVDVDIFFYHGYWYRPYHGHWYRSGSYNGKWAYIIPEKVPRVLIDLPPNYRHVPPGHRHIPYKEVKKNWKGWEKEKYWERHGGKEWHGEKWEHEEGHGKGHNGGNGRGKGKHGD